MKTRTIALLLVLAATSFAADSTLPLPTPPPKFDLKGLRMGLALADYLPRKNIQLVPKGPSLDIQVVITGSTLADLPADFTLSFLVPDAATWTKFFTGQVADFVEIKTPAQKAAAQNITLENAVATFKAADFDAIVKALTLKYGTPKVKQATFTLPSGEELPNATYQWIVEDVTIILKHYGEKISVGFFSATTTHGYELLANAKKAAAAHALKDL